MRLTPSQFRTKHRRNPTNAEAVMWETLRNRALGGYKFTRQMTIGQYTVDFTCRARKLVVEVDGPVHDYSHSDEARAFWLNRQGYAVVRFNNHQVLTDRHFVTTAILQLLENVFEESADLYSSPALPPERVTC